MTALTIRAAQLIEYGATDRVVLSDVPAPEPRARELLVEVRAAAVNPVDCKIRQGTQRVLVPRKLPVTLGMDLSGVVRAVGRDVTRFAVGDEVFASPNHHQMGAYAELATVRESEVAHKPRSLSHVDAASLPLVALTAWDALVTHARLQPGERVLIQAGAGGVGSIAIQLAKHLGATVLTTCSPRNAKFVEQLGADRAIDYRTERYEEVARGVDVVIDALGGEDLESATRLVRRGGRVIALSTSLPQDVAQYGPWLGTARALLRLASLIVRARLIRGVRVRPMARLPSGENLATIAKLVDEGVLRPVVDSVLPLSQVAQAHERVEAGHCRGKIVLDTTLT